MHDSKKKMNSFFILINAPFGCLKITAFSLYLFFSFYLQLKNQQKSRSSSCGPIYSYPNFTKNFFFLFWPTLKQFIDGVPSVVFADAKHTKASSQHCYNLELVYGVI